MNTLRFLRYGEKGEERPAVLDQDGNIRSVHQYLDDIDATVLDQLDSILSGIDIAALPLIDADVRIAPPIAAPGNVIAVGLNYREHIQETSSKTPDEPLLFNKSPHAICGANDPIMIPKGAERVDWEVELVIVIGRESRYLTKEQALSAIGGFCLGVDVSERDFQKNHSGQWMKGKSADTFGPVGPYLVSTSQVNLDDGLSLWLDVNGTRKQEASTLQMMHDVPALISYISQFMSLHPGDLIFTGTPDGVGMARNPPEFLQLGDRVECGITGLGKQKHTVIASTD